MLKNNVFLLGLLLVAVSACHREPDPDPVGQVVKGRVVRYTSVPGDGSVGYAAEVTYNTLGRVLETRWSAVPAGAGAVGLPALETFTYDFSGQCIARDRQSAASRELVLYRYEDGRHVRTEYYTDDIGNPATPLVFTRYERLIHNVDRQVIVVENYENGVYSGRTDFTYNTGGDIAKTVRTDPDDAVLQITTYTYTTRPDPLNFVPGPVYLFPTLPASYTVETPGSGTVTFLYRYEHDAAGLPIRQELLQPDGQVGLVREFFY